MSRNLPSLHRDLSIDKAFGHRIAIYVRWPDSGQETPLRAFARSQPGNWHIVKVYAGDGLSKVRDSANMLRDAKAGVFDTLLVHSLDRLTRNMSSLARLVEELADANVAVRSATEPFDTSTPVGRVLVSMFAASAEMERNMRRRTAAAEGRHAAKRRGHLDG